jgi:hypothetical protein
MLENVETEKTQTVLKPYKQNTFEHYIEWRALGGMVIDEEDPNTPNKVRIMTFQQFCHEFDVSAETIRRWKRDIPDLEQKIEQRMNEIVPLARRQAVWNANFVMALQTQDKRAAVEAQKLFLGHFGNLKIPTQRQEIEHKFNAADLLVAAKTDGVIDGEVVHGSDDHTGTNGENPRPLPDAS